jgi:tetratricopeptide (TPR) repeat protein
MTTNADSRTTPKPGQYQEALVLAEEGRCDEALACIQEYLASAPNDAEALNDTGTLLFSLGYIDEAVNHLDKAGRLFPDSPEILWNRVEVYLAAGQPQQASGLFDRMERLGILNADLLNRTADAFLKNDDPVQALIMLNRSLEIEPRQDILHPMIEVIRAQIARNTKP